MIMNYYNELKTNGFLILDIEDIFPEDIQHLKNLNKNNFTFNRICHTGYKNGYSEFNTYEDGEVIKNKIDPNLVWQIWYSSTNKYNSEIINLFSKIYNLVYPNDMQAITNYPKEYYISMYNKGCFIKNHRDGNDIRIANILIYLNNDYETGKGGELVINETNICEPKFGKIAILDFDSNNPSHKVNIVTDNTFERYAILWSAVKNKI